MKLLKVFATPFHLYRNVLEHGCIDFGRVSLRCLNFAVTFIQLVFCSLGYSEYCSRVKVISPTLLNGWKHNYEDAPWLPWNPSDSKVKQVCVWYVRLRKQTRAN